MFQKHFRNARKLFALLMLPALLPVAAASAASNEVVLPTNTGPVTVSVTSDTMQADQYAFASRPMTHFDFGSYGPYSLDISPAYTAMIERYEIDSGARGMRDFSLTALSERSDVRAAFKVFSHAGVDHNLVGFENCASDDSLRTLLSILPDTWLVEGQNEYDHNQEDGIPGESLGPGSQDVSLPHQQGTVIDVPYAPMTIGAGTMKEPFKFGPCTADGFGIESFPIVSRLTKDHPAIQTTLTSPVAPGAGTLNVVDASGFLPGTAFSLGCDNPGRTGPAEDLVVAEAEGDSIVLAQPVARSHRRGDHAAVSCIAHTLPWYVEMGDYVLPRFRRLLPAAVPLIGPGGTADVRLQMDAAKLGGYNGTVGSNFHGTPSSPEGHLGNGTDASGVRPSGRYVCPRSHVVSYYYSLAFDICTSNATVLGTPKYGPFDGESGYLGVPDGEPTGHDGVMPESIAAVYELRFDLFGLDRGNPAGFLGGRNIVDLFPQHSVGCYAGMIAASPCPGGPPYTLRPTARYTAYRSKQRIFTDPNCELPACTVPPRKLMWSYSTTTAGYCMHALGLYSDGHVIGGCWNPLPAYDRNSHAACATNGMCYIEQKPGYVTIVIPKSWQKIAIRTYDEKTGAFDSPRSASVIASNGAQSFSFALTRDPTLWTAQLPAKR